MACYSPLSGFYDKSGAVVFSRREGTDVEVTVPCGTCVGCRIARSRMWALRIVHESKLWDRNCFVTLSYAPEHLPAYGSLSYPDVQRFHKRLRFHYGRFRFFAAGEYGEELSRPHYHVCYFGFSLPMLEGFVVCQRSGLLRGPRRVFPRYGVRVTFTSES